MTIKSSTDDEHTQLVLRVPRLDDTRHDREVAVLRFIRHYTTIPVPEVTYVESDVVFGAWFPSCANVRLLHDPFLPV